MIDAVRRRLTPLRDRSIIYVLVILVALGFLASAMLWAKGNSETRSRLHQLQDAFCGTGTTPGLLPSILSAPIPKTNVPRWELHVMIGANHAAQIVRCPGVK